MMSQNISYALSIAGFDPSGGAGILADIKTFESIGVYGLGVCSGITFQNDISFERVDWVKKEDILEQFIVLSKRFDIKYVKIGLIESMGCLEYVLNFLKVTNPEMKIIWDPILKATAGFEFHNSEEFQKLDAIYKQLYLITPNREEIRKLLPELKEEAGANSIAENCAVLLKGGHSKGENVRDILFNNKKEHYFDTKRILNGAKHGSGCVLSSAITGYLAQGMVLNDACEKGKIYINEYLASSESLLGFHYKGKDIYAD